MQRGCAGGSGRGYYAPGLRVDVPGRPSLGCSRPVTSCGPGEMRNERLRALLLERGKSPDQLAEHVRVDAKTVERWITRGRLPYRRHRFEVASFLGVDESYIWPDALGKDEIAAVSESEIVAVWPHRSEVPRDIVGTPVLRRRAGDRGAGVRRAVLVRGRGRAEDPQGQGQFGRAGADPARGSGQPGGDRPRGGRGRR